MKDTITFIDLFAGIGGMRLGFESIGAKCVFTSEWDEYAQKTYRANFPGSEIAGDITRVDHNDIPDHDILLAGFPCQPFSLAGVSKKNSLGRAHGFLDLTQGTLFFDVARIIDARRPRAFFLENVRNLVSHDKGNTFRIICRTLEDLGYRIHHRIIDSRCFVPQHRERIFIAGFREPVDFDWGQLPSARPKLDQILHTEPVPDKYVLSDKLWNYLQAYAEKHRAKGNGFGCSVFGPTDTARTLSARYYKDGSEILIGRGEGNNPRRLTPRECARLMGYPDSFQIPVSDTRAYKQFGNSVVVPVIKHAARLMKPLILATLAFAAALSAQTNPASLAAHEYRIKHESEILGEFSRLLSIPNIASDKPNIRRNADTIAAALTKRGVAAQLVEVPNANPVVYGELKTPGASRTIVLYAHYDGQPLDPREWATPPFEPVIKEGRIYARSASDDKAPILAILTALDAIRAAGITLRSDIRFVFEGEEEAGSVNLERILASHRDLFTADVWLICDGPVAQNGQQLIAFGARGVVTVDITLYGARRELHSGHYGNWAPNPAMGLARLLASLKDDDGRVLVDGFYDGIAPLSDVEKRAIAEAPVPDADLMKELWLGSTEGAPKKLIELLQQPSLNIRGMASSRTGAQASNVIPSTATASIDMRLVKGMDHKQTVARLIEHIRKQGYFVTSAEPTEAERAGHPKVARVTMKEGGYNAVRTPMDLPISQEVIRVVESARGPSVKVPTMGGSVPLEMIERAVGTRTITIPIANYDNNQHSFNENIKIENLWNGIDLMAALIAM